jgi:hypothetical protein
MTLERLGIVKFRGRDGTGLGADLKLGLAAPEFSVQTRREELNYSDVLEAARAALV